MEDEIEKQEEVQIIDPDFSLKEKTGNVDLEKVISTEKVRRAEQVVENEKENLGEDLYKEIKRLETIFTDAIKHSDQEQRENLDSMMEMALNIKSGAAIADYTLATEFAKSLYQLCMALSDISDSDKAIIKAHIDAIKKIFNERITDAGGTVEKELLNQLSSYTDRRRKS